MAEGDYALHRQTEAVKALRADLAALGVGDDEDLTLDAIEGETSFLEAVASVLHSIDEDTVLLAGIKARKGELTDRERRIKASIERKRALIERAMTIAETPKLTLPIATLSLARHPPALVVTAEPDIPAAYWRQPDPPPPELNKAALNEALRARAAALAAAGAIEDVAERAKALAAANSTHPAIPGAELDNGSCSLTVRRK